MNDAEIARVLLCVALTLGAAIIAVVLKMLWELTHPPWRDE